MKTLQLIKSPFPIKKMCESLRGGDRNLAGLGICLGLVLAGAQVYPSIQVYADVENTASSSPLNLTLEDFSDSWTGYTGFFDWDLTELLGDPEALKKNREDRAPSSRVRNEGKAFTVKTNYTIAYRRYKSDDPKLQSEYGTPYITEGTVIEREDYHPEDEVRYEVGDIIEKYVTYAPNIPKIREKNNGYPADFTTTVLKDVPNIRIPESLYRREKNNTGNADNGYYAIDSPSYRGIPRQNYDDPERPNLEKPVVSDADVSYKDIKLIESSDNDELIEVKKHLIKHYYDPGFNGDSADFDKDPYNSVSERINENTLAYTEEKTLIGASDKLKKLLNREESISAGSSNIHVKLDESLNATGGKNYIVDVNKDLNLTDKGSLTIGGVQLANDKVNVGGNKIAHVGNGEVSANSRDAINGSQLHETNLNVARNTDGIKKNANQISKNEANIITNANNIALNAAEIEETKNEISKGLWSQSGDGKRIQYHFGDTFYVVGDGKNIRTVSEGGKIQVKLNDDVTLKTVSADKFKSGDVLISSNRINAGGNKIENVAPGEISAESKDAVNGSQIHRLINNFTSVSDNITNNFAQIEDNQRTINYKLDNLDKVAKAGIAGSNASAALPQVRGHGKSMFAIAAGTFKGSNAIAAGYSRASENGKWLLKLHGNVNVEDVKTAGGGIGIGYEY